MQHPEERKKPTQESSEARYPTRSRALSGDAASGVDGLIRVRLRKRRTQGSRARAIGASTAAGDTTERGAGGRREGRRRRRASSFSARAREQTARRAEAVLPAGTSRRLAIGTICARMTGRGVRGGRGDAARSGDGAVIKGFDRLASFVLDGAERKFEASSLRRGSFRLRGMKIPAMLDLGGGGPDQQRDMVRLAEAGVEQREVVGVERKSFAGMAAIKADGVNAGRQSAVRWRDPGGPARRRLGGTADRRCSRTPRFISFDP